MRTEGQLYERIAQLAQSRMDGWTLPQDFYTDPEIFAHELDTFFSDTWLFVGHSCQIPNKGDYFVVTFHRTSLVLIRGEEGKIYAHHNVCRHRGTMLCHQEQGHAERLTCPYHQWTYKIDGTLIATWGMQELDRSKLGLRSVHVENLEGMIFVNLAANPSSFTTMRQGLEDLARPQGMERAKVAKIIDYQVKANWKLVWENNRECYHCNLNHPQYIRANFDHVNDDDATDKIQNRLRSINEKYEAADVKLTHRKYGMTTFPDPNSDVMFIGNRTPTTENYQSETMDGKLAAPLMGDYVKNMGTLRMRSLPNFWNHSSCDHVVSTMMLPQSPTLTTCRVIWLVDRDAVEGRDYTLDALLPFWALTSEQDWDLCEKAQLGVQSTGYQPGPYSTFKEYNVDAFNSWYIKRIQGRAKTQAYQYSTLS